MKDHLISSWKNATKKSKSNLKRSIKRLVGKKNKRIDDDANEVHIQVFDELNCLDCANCCKSIPPMFIRSDIRRIAKFLRIKEKEFELQYLRIDEDGDFVMKTSPCVFLDPDNKCDIYEVRPKACREYPHTDNYSFKRNAHLHAKNVNYCPAVFHILERLNRFV